jgi:hypothetical protein
MKEPQGVVYLLGAGASKGSSFQLKTMDEVMPRCEDAYSDLPALRSLLNTVCPGFPVVAVNIETVMTHLNVALDHRGLETSRRLDLQRAEYQLENLLVERLSIAPTSNPSADHVALLTKAEEEKATILSLNYDLVLEHALGDGFRTFKMASRSLALNDTQHPQEYQDTGRFIQLHGALNWWRCPTRECRDHNELHIREVQAPDPSANLQDAACRQCGARRKRAIVPPTMKGVFGTLGRLAFLWGVALSDLKRANRIVIVGVSFARSDYVLEWLFREAYYDNQNAELVIVNPSEPDAKRALAVTGVNAAPRFDSLHEILNAGTSQQVRADA